ncbi:hypothetical protein HK16_08880 [Acetobacter senegalensis]|uniref:DUF4440 domain-containing protein n=3 Tax=Acetobacteraceae TaxID=433 RepID=A0A0U5ESA1_9PROT|nr:hypothetical protein CIW82_05385 [Acetobacter tropicalis]OUL66488.1 hypothetical protein HK16_08880 [Acetobacter senegalensis]CEF40700.1 hypothetical protein ASN_1336 [Acetobacter senegalensis]
MENMINNVTYEIIELHRLLQAWFRGENEEPLSCLLAHFAPGYMMVGAAGRVITLEGFEKALPSLKGSRPGLIMEIFDVKICQTFDGGILAFYREVQTQGEARTERWSTVLFVENAAKTQLLWKHLQETFLS